MFRITTIASCLFAVATGSAIAQSKDDPALFNAALAHFSAEFERNQKIPARFLIFNETAIVLPEDLGFTGKDLPPDLADALITYNSVPQSIAKYSPPESYRLCSAVTLGSAFEESPPGSVRPHHYNWGVLRAQFPDFRGVLELASPAYSADGNTALLYFWTGCGPLCGSGYIYIVEKSNGTWRVAKTFLPWVS